MSRFGQDDFGRSKSQKVEWVGHRLEMIDKGAPIWPSGMDNWKQKEKGDCVQEETGDMNHQLNFDWVISGTALYHAETSSKMETC